MRSKIGLCGLQWQGSGRPSRRLIHNKTIATTTAATDDQFRSGHEEWIVVREKRGCLGDFAAARSGGQA